MDAVREFAAELVREPDILRRLLPCMSQQLEPRGGRHPQRMTRAFGEAIADFADAPLDWLACITEALHELPQEARDFDPLSGYLVGINNDLPEEVEQFKERAAESDVLAPALPLVCWRLGIVASDIPLVLSALHAGRLPPWRLMQWTLGGMLRAVEAPSVAPAFDALIDHSVEGCPAWHRSRTASGCGSSPAQRCGPPPSRYPRPGRSRSRFRPPAGRGRGWRPG